MLRLERADIDRIVVESRRKISDLDIGWLAGIIDGEGSITISPRKRTDGKCRIHGWQVSVRVSNNDPKMIQKICALTKLINGCKGYVTEKRPNRCRKHYYWMIASRKALAFLKLIEPYLISKREQAKIAIMLQERVTMSMGLQIINRNNLGQITKGYHLQPEEEEIRYSLYHKIKILNRKIPTKFEEERLECEKITG